MSFYATEARVSKDPLVGLVKRAATDEHPDKLTAIIGSAMDDNGKLIVPEAVIETGKEIAEEGINMAYLPSSGLAGLGDAITAEVLGIKTAKALKEMGIHNSAITCAGGTNAISVALMACTGADDPVISHNPHWPGYDSISLSLAKKPILNFDILNAENKFNLEAFSKLVDETAAKSNKLSIVFNTPYDNPLGQDFGVEAWKEIASVLSKYQDKEILMILDTAYLDFGPKGKDYNRLSFLPDLFKTVNNKNFNLVLAATFSKSFAMYGARVGAPILLSPNEELAANWVDIAGGIVRGTFSNASRFGEELALRILKDAKKLADIHDYQEKTVKLISERNEFFTKLLSEKQSEDSIFKIIPAHGGFFTSLRIKNANIAAQLSETLIADHYYIPVIANEFMRIPTCGINEAKIEKVVNKLIEVETKLKSAA